MDDRDAPAGYGMGRRGKAVMMMIMYHEFGKGNGG